MFCRRQIQKPKPAPTQPPRESSLSSKLPSNLKFPENYYVNEQLLVVRGNGGDTNDNRWSRLNLNFPDNYYVNEQGLVVRFARQRDRIAEVMHDDAGAAPGPGRRTRPRSNTEPLPYAIEVLESEEEDMSPPPMPTPVWDDGLDLHGTRGAVALLHRDPLSCSILSPRSSTHRFSRKGSFSSLYRLQEENGPPGELSIICML